MKAYGAEFFGNFWLVFGGCGSAVLAAGFPQLGIGFAGVALAFGLTVLTMAFAVGHISGAHFNPAVSIGLWAGGRFPASKLLPYIVSQVIGGIAGAAVLWFIASGKAGFDGAHSFALNGYDAGSPGGYPLSSALVAEIVLTGFFVIVILGSTSKRGVPAGFAPIAIGLALTLIHLISIPVTNTSVNPARSTAVAVISGNALAIQQLWLFWVAPIIGALLGAVSFRMISEGTDRFYCNKIKRLLHRNLFIVFILSCYSVFLAHLNFRSLSSIATSLILANRFCIKPSAANSQFSLP